LEHLDPLGRCLARLAGDKKEKAVISRVDLATELALSFDESPAESIEE